MSAGWSCCGFFNYWRGKICESHSHYLKRASTPACAGRCFTLQFPCFVVFVNQAELRQAGLSTHGSKAQVNVRSLQETIWGNVYLALIGYSCSCFRELAGAGFQKAEIWKKHKRLSDPKLISYAKTCACYASLPLWFKSLYRSQQPGQRLWQKYYFFTFFAN